MYVANCVKTWSASIPILHYNYVNILIPLYYTNISYHPFCHTYMCEETGFWEFSNARKLTAIFWNSSTSENEASSCFPFRVAFNDDQGHYLIATRDIQPGELVMKDRPFAEGPGSKSPPVCLQCAKDAPTYRCSKWVWMST